MNATTERCIQFWVHQLAICEPEAKEGIEIEIALLQTGARTSVLNSIKRMWLHQRWLSGIDELAKAFATWENFYAFAERLETGEFDGLLLSGRNVGAKTLADFKQAVAKVVASRLPA